MADGENDWSGSRVVRVYRPQNEESWFPIDPRHHRIVRNRFVNGVRCIIVHVIQTVDGYAHWKIDDQPVRPNQLMKLESARHRKQRVRVANVLVDPANLKARGHVVARELLCVNDEPKLELKQCYASPDETVQLVAVGLRETLQPEPMDCEPEVVIEPVSGAEHNPEAFVEIPVVFVKQEPIDPDEAQSPASIREIESVPPLIISEDTALTRRRRSRRLCALTQPPGNFETDRSRRRRRRKREKKES